METIDTYMVAELTAILRESPDTAHLRLSEDNPSEKPDWPFSGYDFYTDYCAAVDADGEPVVMAYRWFRYKNWWARVGDDSIGGEFDTPVAAMRAAMAVWRKQQGEKQLALFAEPAPTSPSVPVIPHATDVGGIAIGLRSIPKPEVKVIDGITHVISNGYAHVTMELDEDNTAVIQFKSFPSPHWQWEILVNGTNWIHFSESFEAAHKAILKIWRKEEK